MSKSLKFSFIIISIILIPLLLVALVYADAEGGVEENYQQSSEQTKP